MGRIKVKLSEIITEVERRAKADHCVQMTWLLEWINARRPAKSVYDAKRYAAKKKAADQALRDKLRKRK